MKKAFINERSLWQLVWQRIKKAFIVIKTKKKHKNTREKNEQRPTERNFDSFPPAAAAKKTTGIKTRRRGKKKNS